MAFEIFPDQSNERFALCADALELYSAESSMLPARSPDDIGDARIALARAARAESVAVLNQVLADTMTLRDLYKKHYWQTFGPAFYSLRELFDKHHAQQAALIDGIGERIQILGGTAIAMAADVAVTTMLALPRAGHEEPLRQLARLSDAHERILSFVRGATRRVAALGDTGTNDLLVSAVIRTNEKQAWFVLQQSAGISA